LNWYKIDTKWFDLDFHPDLSDVDEDTLIKILLHSPYYKATAQDVDWEMKVAMQGAVQRWIDHSISCTVNLPTEATVDLVGRVLMKAWETGCKGITVYREGSRVGILQTEKREAFEYQEPEKRLESLECDVYRKTALKKNWMILVGLLKGKPYEIFALTAPWNYQFPFPIKKGIIQKTEFGAYRLTGEYEGKEYVIENVLDLISDNDGISTRKYSLMLRHRVHPKYIVREIDKYALITSFEKVIGRVLKYYLNGHKNGEQCPECGADLMFEDGCVKCSSCSFSKCG
jgi:ribonucleoside-diphosphate reductase alpha chain